ncbi:13388_t:CDS:2, partial [Acaulospora morrowiae]
FSSLNLLYLSDSGSFQEDPNYKSFTNFPVVKSTCALMMIVESMCVILHTISSHQEAFGRMIISLLTQYYVKCFEQYQAIVTKNSAESNAVETGNLQGVSATWVQQDQLSEVLNQYPYQVDDSNKNRRLRKMLCDKETKVEMNLKKNRFIRYGELINENKKLTSLGLLYHSL